ncbi:tyrosine-protein phosphatase [Myroides sp. LJL119]
MLKHAFTSNLQNTSTTNYLLESQPNFRDLGGYITREKKYIKKGLIYRSGQLNGLSITDQTKLSNLGVDTAIDFRSQQEIDSNNSPMPLCIHQVIELSINPGNLKFSTIQNMIQTGEVEQSEHFLMDINQQLVLHNQTQFKSFFNILEHRKQTPLVFNCTAGKDRTGLAAALFLSALEVDRQTIYNDYLKTNQRVEPFIKNILTTYKLDNPKQIQATINLMSVKLSYIQYAFKTIDKHYQNVDNFLDNILKVDRLRLKELYLD